MFCRIFFFLLGFGLMVIGFMHIILYSNLLSLDYSFIQYISFIKNKIECLFSIIGLIIVTLSIFLKKGES